MKLEIQIIDPNATLPVRAHSGDAGFDLSSCEHVVIQPGEWAPVRTGIAMKLPAGTVGLVHPRSGLAAWLGVTVLNAPGTIDESYRGEVQVILINHGRNAFGVAPGDRVAQLVIQKYEVPTVEIVAALSESDRGDAGFGSTGIA